MGSNNYQLDYASGRPQMYNKDSRQKKAIRIVKTLEDYYGSQEKLKKLTVLDVGSSTGIIDYNLAKYFKKLVGSDIDKKAINFSKKNFKLKNLEFKIEDAMKLSFKESSFDAVICTQVYEHVPNSQILFNEIYRVLKPNGICYLAALNRLWPMEPHYNLPFLAWFSKPISNLYVRLLGKAEKYYETPETYWKLKKLTDKFSVIDYTSKILTDPKKFGYESKYYTLIGPIVKPFVQILKFLTPTLFWILIKKN